MSVAVIIYFVGMGFGIASFIVLLIHMLKYKTMDGEFLLSVFIVTFVPAINLLCIILFICGIYILIEESLENYKHNKKKQKEDNKFVECRKCTILTRKGYIEKNVCPGCKEDSTFKDYNEKFKGSQNIYFHEKIKHKKLKSNKMKNKLSEQEQLYQELLEKNLRKESEKEKQLEK